MYEFIISNYINNKLSLTDIYNFANKNNTKITDNEAKIIYEYIKKYWLIFYKGNPTNLFNELKEKVSKTTYNKIIELYNFYLPLKK